MTPEQFRQWFATLPEKYQRSPLHVRQRPQVGHTHRVKPCADSHVGYRPDQI